jgi:hypothetical protein
MARPNKRLAFAALVTAVTAAAPASAQAEAAGVPAVSPAPPAPAIILKAGTLVHLMVLKEVTTQTAYVGQEFVMQVNDDVLVDGVKVIPLGTKAFGEIVAAERSGLVGKSGKLATRLAYIDARGDHIPLTGEAHTAGTHGAATTVAATVGFAMMGAGPLGLLTRGTNAKLKAGEIITGYVANDTPFGAAEGAVARAAGN